MKSRPDVCMIWTAYSHNFYISKILFCSYNRHETLKKNNNYRLVGAIKEDFLLHNKSMTLYKNPGESAFK